MNEIREIIDKLHKYEDAYNKGTPLISDKEYDDLYFKLEKLEKENNIIYSDSPLHSITYKKINKLKKISHKENPMLSLSKTKDWNELSKWVVKPAIISLKLDGISCRLIYENGKLVEAHSRGDGEEGNLITAAAYTFTNIPLTINIKDKIIIDGEALITYDVFENFKDDYANPRNLVAGTLNLLSSIEVAKRKVKFVAWSLINSTFNTYQDDLEFITQLGFDVVPYWSFSEKADIQSYKDIAKNYHYPIDGLVVRFNDNEYYNSLGRNAHDFYGAKSFKFYDEEYETTLRNIEWSMGRTGQLTPVAIFDDIDFGDSVVNRASLHNLSIMEQLYPYNWHSGLKMKVFKANAIIPQVSKVWFDKGSCAQRVDCPFCPVCGEPTTVVEENDSKILYCLNPECSGKLNKRIEHFCSKKGMDIKGLSKKTIEKLIDWEWLNSISDLYELNSHRKDWVNKAGFGVASTDKILKAIEESKNFALDKFICGLGIPEIGSTAAKDLKNKFQTWENFRNATKDELLELPNFGDIMVNYILTFDYTEADEIVNKYMQTNTVDIALNDFTEEVNSNIQKELTLIGKVFTITGKLSKKRDDIITDIEAAGGKVTGNVSKKTTYLVNNDAKSTSAKNKKAKELNIPIISEEELYKMIGE